MEACEEGVREEIWEEGEPPVHGEAAFARMVVLREGLPLDYGEGDGVL